jgi:beta-phosphoglucomutase-like phosphatase (HAD superfamily)
MTRTHVLIDLDGTLSDSHAGIARSLQYAFAECGFEPPTDHAVRDVIGPPFEVSFPKLGVGPDDFDRVVDKYRERYNDIGLFENTVYDGIPEMLETLRRPHARTRHSQARRTSAKDHRTLRLQPPLRLRSGRQREAWQSAHQSRRHHVRTGCTQHLCRRSRRHARRSQP